MTIFTKSSSVLDHRYISSGSWKCPSAKIDSNYPIQVEQGVGAHHWVWKWLGAKVGYAWLCILCYDVRKQGEMTRWGTRAMDEATEQVKEQLERKA